jgi:branched-chain amino acid transport system ATP-binding protein
MSHLSANARAAGGIAFVPEVRGNIFSTLSVRENIELGLRMVPVGERLQARAFMLDLFPILADRLSAAAGMMSGGEQQMLAIAMAAARRPAVILLDEPTQGLAPVIYDDLERAFAVLKREGAALLIAEQNLPFARRIADRFVVLSEGGLTLAGSAAELSREDAVVASFFGSDTLPGRAQ